MKTKISKKTLKTIHKSVANLKKGIAAPPIKLDKELKLFKINTITHVWADNLQSVNNLFNKYFCDTIDLSIEEVIK